MHFCKCIKQRHFYGNFKFLLQATPITDSLATAATNPATTDVSITENISYLEFLLKGGIMIFPLIALLFYCVYVIIERYLSIKKHLNRISI